jgi:hypothetical protein
MLPQPLLAYQQPQPTLSTYSPNSLGGFHSGNPTKTTPLNGVPGLGAVAPHYNSPLSPRTGRANNSANSAEAAKTRTNDGGRIDSPELYNYDQDLSGPFAHQLP